MAQLVEHNLAKVGVAGSSPVVRSRIHSLAYAGLFNMSRTLSRGVIGPGPEIVGARPSLYINPPAATSACLSDARLCSLISARGNLLLGNPLLRLRLPRRLDSLFTRVAPAALAKKETGVRPNGLGSGRRWDD